MGRSVLPLCCRSRSWLCWNRIWHIRPFPSGSLPQLTFPVMFWILSSQGPPPLRDKGTTTKNIGILDHLSILHLTDFTAWKTQSRTLKKLGKETNNQFLEEVAAQNRNTRSAQYTIGSRTAARKTLQLKIRCTCTKVKTWHYDAFGSRTIYD